MGRPQQHSPDDADRSHHSHHWTAIDGTGLHAPPGELVRDPDTGEVCCHVCGDYFHALGSHVRSHGYSAAEYRRVMGLSRTKPLTSPDMSASISDRQRQRYADSAEHRQLLAPGQQMVRDGRLTHLARNSDRMRQQSVAARNNALSQGRATRSNERAAELSTRLEELGVADCGAWMVGQYRDGTSIEALASTLGISRERARRHLSTAGVDIRPAGVNTVEGKRSRALANEARAAARVGTDDLGEWLREQRRRGLTLTELSRLVGHSSHWVRWRIERDEGATQSMASTAHTSR